MVRGVELGRRRARPSLFGRTAPRITPASGARVGRTAQGAVWLNTARLSAYDYWQYWRDVEDADVGRFLRLFSELPEDEIARLEALEGAEINAAKKRLADEATRLCHGAAAAETAAETARRTFEEGALGQDLPTIEVPRDRLAQGIPAYALLRESGLTASNGEARPLIEGGGGRIHDAALDSPARGVARDDLNSDGRLKLSAGQHRHAPLRAVQRPL